MARGSVADRLLGKHRTGKRKVGTKDLTRAQRLRIAPKLSGKPRLLYLKLLTQGVLGPIQAAIKQHVYPLLSTIAKPEEPTPIPHHGVRLDASLTRSIRMDTGPTGYEGNSDFETAFENVSVVVTEITRDPRLIRILRQVAQGVDQSNASELSRLLELDLSKDRMLTTFMEGFIRDNVSLITSIAQEQLSKVQEIVTASHQGQYPAAVLRDRIESTFDVTRSRANLIARDQTLKANADLTQVRQTRAGVREYIWSTSNDERVRGRDPALKSESDHWALEGTVQRWDTPPITNPVTGVTNHPGRDYQCRCVAIPVLDNLVD